MVRLTQFKDRSRVASFLWLFADTRAIIVGLALLHLVVTYIWVKDWYEEFAEGPVSFYPDKFIFVPLLLLLASILLFLRKAWSYTLALIISVWVLYLVGYVTMRGVAAAHDMPLLTLSTLRLWFSQMYLGQPQHFLQLALAFVIGGHAVVAFSRYWSRGEP